MQSTIDAVEIILFVFDLIFGGFGETDDALMAATRHTDQPLVHHIEIHGLFAIDTADDRDRKHICGHARNVEIKPVLDRDEFTLVAAVLDILQPFRIETFRNIDGDFRVILEGFGSSLIMQTRLLTNVGEGIANCQYEGFFQKEAIARL